MQLVVHNTTNRRYKGGSNGHLSAAGPPRYGRANATHSGISSRAPTATTMYCRPSCR